jgi:hypothetical protein
MTPSLSTVTLHIDTGEAVRLLSELQSSLEQAVTATEAAAERYDNLAQRLIESLRPATPADN